MEPAAAAAVAAPAATASAAALSLLGPEGAPTPEVTAPKFAVPQVAKRRLKARIGTKDRIEILIQNITWFGDATKKHLYELDASHPELAHPDLLCIQERHLMGQQVDRATKWLDQRHAMTSLWAQGRPGDGKGILGGALIACHNALRHRYSVLPAEIPDDPTSPAHIPCSGLDWAAVVVRTKRAHIAIVSLYVRPGGNDDHVITFQQIRRYLQHANLPFILAGDFNASPEKMASRGFLSGLKGSFLTPLGANPTTCHTSTTATLIDYCFIDHRIVALCTLKASGTPWPTHQALKLSIDLKWDSLTARVILGPKPFPFEDDELTPKAPLAKVTDMSLDDLKTNKVRSHEIPLESHFELVGATNCVVTRGDSEDRRVPFINHATATVCFGKANLRAARQVDALYGGAQATLEAFCCRDKGDICHNTLLREADPLACAKITHDLMVWAGSLEEYYLANWPHVLTERQQNKIRGRCMPPKITIQPVVNRGNKASTPSGALLVQLRTIYNQIVHLRALQATRGTLEYMLCNRLHDRALAAGNAADEARRTDGLPEHLLDVVAESIGPAKRCARVKGPQAMVTLDVALATHKANLALVAAYARKRDELRIDEWIALTLRKEASLAHKWAKGIAPAVPPASDKHKGPIPLLDCKRQEWLPRWQRDWSNVDEIQKLCSEVHAMAKDIDPVQINEDQLAIHLGRARASRATGLDGLTNQDLRHAPADARPGLCSIINDIMRTLIAPAQ